MTAAYRTKTYLLTAYLVFMTSMLVCILIRPELSDHPDYGLSFFGSFLNTIVPYALGLLTVIYCLWAVARELRPHKGTLMLRLGYLFGAGSLLGILLTPMGLHPVLWWTHIGVSLVLLTSQVTVCIWVLLQKDANWIDYLLGVVFFAGGIATFLSGTWPGVLGVYAIGELVVFTTSLLLLGRASLRILSRG